MRVFLCHNNVSSVHVWLVANSYLLLTHYSVSQNMTEDCGKCVVPKAWTFYVANSMQHFLLYLTLYMLNNMYMTQKHMLWTSTGIFFYSCYVWKAMFKKKHGPTAFIGLVSHFLYDFLMWNLIKVCLLTAL